MPQIQLTRKTFPQWQQLSKGYLAGSVYAAGQWLEPQQVAARLAEVQSVADLQVVLADWNGFFALIWEAEDTAFLVADIARSIPLFWRVGETEVTIKDQLTAADGIATVWQQEQVLVQTEFVPGHATLRYGWQQLQAGEILEMKGRMCYMHTHFSHRRGTPSTQTEAELKADFSELLRAQATRLVEWADGRTIVIPLSGGYDSRILLALLHQMNYPKLKAFTYGQADSWEVKVAREVAEKLDVDWQFVAYTPELLARFGDENWTTYADYAGNLSALPQDQDYFALAHLREAGWLAAGSIICPGYCGDFQAGSYLPENYFKLPWRKTTSALQQYLYHRFVRYPSAAQWQIWGPILPQQEVANEEDIISELENWVLREYVPKFILNGVRAYEWFDCAWYLPLWDKAFIRFWQLVPNHLREGMRMYREVLADDYFVPLDIDFPEDHPSSGNSSSNWLGDLIPAAAKNHLKANLKPAEAVTDINGIHVLIPLIQEKLGWPETNLHRSVNEMLGHWYLNHIAQQDQNNANLSVQDSSL